MILVLIEHRDGEPDIPSLQTLSFARTLAAQTGSSIEAVAFGSDSLADTLRDYGVSRYHSITDDPLVTYAAEAWAVSLKQLTDSISPKVLLAPGSIKGNEVMAYVGALSSLSVATNVCQVDAGNEWRITRTSWGGGLFEKVLIDQDLALLTLATNTVEASESAVDICDTVSFTPTLEKKHFRAQVKSVEPSVDEGMSLKTASIVVGGGRGVGSAEGFAVLEELGEILKAAVGGSRVTTNNGWRAHKQQIGLTGNHISPKLYIACGISGAIQHMAGCKNSENILVINTDENAPMLSHADYGVIGDLHEIVPAIIEELKNS
jgi:electron transfer flavoprotein alpha subunit